VLSRKELEREHTAHSLLLRAEETLSSVIEGWGLGDVSLPKKKGRGRKPVAKKGGRRKTVAPQSVAEEEGEKLEFGSAGEFGKWWRAGVEEA
jgi:hypothetical protein